MDYEITDTGSVFLFRPVSSRAIEHATTFNGDQDPGNGMPVDRRYAFDIIHRLVSNEHFAVALDGREIAEITPR